MHNYLDKHITKQDLIDALSRIWVMIKDDLDYEDRKELLQEYIALRAVDEHEA